MAQLITITNPLTGKPQQMWQSDYTAQQIDDRLTILSGENLLDNVNFCNPVNQRGVSGTISTPGFFIDRWKLISGTAQLTAAGIILNGTMQQTREFSVGYTTTASALTTTGVVSATYDDSTKIFTLTGTGQTFITAKLELGNVSTVGYQNSGGVWVPTEIQRFEDEIAKCQRFLFNSMYGESGENGVFKNEVWTAMVGTTHFASGVRFPQKMASTPVITFYSAAQRTENAVAYGSSGANALATPQATFAGTGGFSQINLNGDDPTLTGNQISFFIIANAEI